MAVHNTSCCAINVAAATTKSPRMDHERVIGLLTSRHVTGAGPVAHWKQVTNVQVCTYVHQRVFLELYILG